MKKICVLLSTYNGEKYLEQQLESIVAQEDVDLDIIARDDGSTDDTISILKRWQEKCLIKCYRGDNIGVKNSFLDLLFSAPNDRYYAFSDQDDVWLSQKLKLSLDKMVAIEKLHKNKPVIIHTDMKVVDKDLNVLYESFWKLNRFRPELLNNFINLAASNGLNGCTMLLNETARDLIKEKMFEQNVVIHDVFCSLIVSAYNGIIDYVDVPTVLYRQHDVNVVGAKPYRFSEKIKKLKHPNRMLKDNIDFYRLLNKIHRIGFFHYWYRKIWYYSIR